MRDRTQRLRGIDGRVSETTDPWEGVIAVHALKRKGAVSMRVTRPGVPLRARSRLSVRRGMSW